MHKIEVKETKEGWHLTCKCNAECVVHVTERIPRRIERVGQFLADHWAPEDPINVAQLIDQVTPDFNRVIEEMERAVAIPELPGDEWIPSFA